MNSPADNHGIQIVGKSEYLQDRSLPGTVYYFAYEITISNQGDQPAHLLTRHWIITDSEGREEHVDGPGVVGETPLLQPGDSFRYVSFCPLSTEVGSMRGHYHFIRPNGREFDAEIAAFVLAVPFAIN